MMESGIVFTPPLHVGALTQRVYRVNGCSMTEVLPDGTYGETLPLATANVTQKSPRRAGPPALLRRLRNAQRALKRARTVERRAASRVYTAEAALDAANGKPDPVTGTWSYKVTFAERPA